MAKEVEEQLDPSQRQLAEFDAQETNEESGSDLEHGLESYESNAGVEDEEEVREERVVPDSEDGIEIVADQRELDSTIARDLSTREGISTRLETLDVGDYVLSDRVAVERKSVSDFLDTLVGGDRSVFEQVGDMARHYSRPVVIIEGERLYEERNVHPNAIRGALASLAIDFGASVLRTEDEADTADLLAVIAGREQEVDSREVSVHGKKSSKTLSEQQEYVVGAIADIGPVTARSLLSEFESVESVLTASEEALMEAEGVGEITAKRIREVVGSRYEK